MSNSFVKVPGPDLMQKYSSEVSASLWNVPIQASILFSGVWAKGDVEYRMLQNPFRLNDQLDNLLDPFMSSIKNLNSGKQLTDGATVRLQDARMVGGKLTLTFQPATYFKYLLTNWAAGQNYGVCYDSGAPVPLRDIVEPGPFLNPLADAPAANHVGVSCILLCEDQVVLSLRSGRQITDGGMLGLSASGVLAHEDERTDPFRHALTELREELGLSEGEVDYGTVRLLGIAREHQRAGKPEMFFLMRSMLPLDQLKDVILQRKGIDSWEAVDFVWLNPFSGDEWGEVLAQNVIQPAARIGLSMLFEAMEDHKLDLVPHR